MEIRSPFVILRDPQVMAETILNSPLGDSRVRDFVRLYIFKDVRFLHGLIYEGIKELLLACTSIQLVGSEIQAVGSFSLPKLLEHEARFYQVKASLFVMRDHQSPTLTLLDCLLCTSRFSKYNVAQTMIAQLPNLVRPV